MPFQRSLYALASALAAGTVLAAAGCGGVAPLGPDPAPVNLPPPRQLDSPIVMQVMRSRPPTPAGRCPAGSVDLFGLALVPRAAAAPSRLQRRHTGHGGTPPPAPPAPPPGPASPPPPLPVGVACYLPAGKPVTITSAAVSSVVTYPPPPGTPKGPLVYGFIVGIPAADRAAATAVFNQAYRLGADVGLSVAGKLWQARQADRTTTVQGAQILLLSRSQAVQLHRLLVASG
jgi:hypothetical protein